jgi:hypothetical protein
MVRGDTVMGINQRLITVAASQTIYPGDILVLSGGAGSPTVQQAITAPSAGSATNSSGSLALYGVALEPITTNASGVEASTGKTKISVAIFDSNLRLATRVYNATPASARLSALTVNSTYKIARYTPAAGAGNPFYCLSTSATGEVAYAEPYVGSADTDNYGVAWIRNNTYLG